MGSESKSIIGSALAAVGTISAAIGSTPSNYLNSNFRDDLVLLGNVLQAEGNAIEADVKGNVIRTVGKEFTAIGNLTVIIGLILDLKKETSYKLFVKGNLIQALGIAINIGDGIELPPFPGQPENIVGNLLQFIGNSLQAIGWTYEIENIKKDDDYIEYKSKKNGYGYEYFLEKNDGQSEIVTGSWIQAIGSVVSVIGTIKEATQ